MGPAQVLQALTDNGRLLATAESLTGGRLAAELTTVPGASRAFVGGVVAYSPDVKRLVLGVPTEVIREHGVVSQACAVAMADGVRRLTAADLGVATTGVAGPEASEGKPVGTVHIAVVGPGGTRSRELGLRGDRGSIVEQTCDEALVLVAESWLALVEPTTEETETR